MNNSTAVLGLGAMGAGMAHNLNAAGLLGAVWNRSAERARAWDDELADASPKLVISNGSDQLLAIAGQCDTLLLSVSADADVLEVVEALAPALTARHLIIDTSTTSPQTARRAAELAGPAGFVDAPVSGGVEGAGLGQLVIMAGASEADYARASEVFAAIGKHAQRLGPVGSGQATKAVNQLMAAGINQAVSEALAFAESLDLPLEQVIELISGGAAGNWFLQHRGPSMSQSEFAPGFRVVLHDKDLGICQQMAAARQVHLPLVEMTRIHYQRLIEQGYGDEDISSLLRLKRQLFSTPPAAAKGEK